MPLKTIILMSDSHGYTEEISFIRRRHDPDIVFHCGDSELMADDGALQGMTVVKGNCDRVQQFHQDELVDIEGIRFFITHGHLYNVKQNLTSLSYRASEVEADIVCFGHSHIVYAEQDEHHLYLNPGSVRFPRSPRFPSYVILEIDERDIHWSLWTVEGEKKESKIFIVK